LHADAQQQLSETVLLSLISTVQVSAAGRVEAKHGAVSDDPERLTAQSRAAARTRQALVATHGVLPALEVVRLDHGLRWEDFLGLAQRSPFVPTGRELSFARGLVAGFYGEFDVAAHMLMPQFENAVRWHLEQRGVVMTTLPVSGIQNELDLNQLLRCKEAAELFGEAGVFDLQTLLIEKAGVNLRNELAHGLSADGSVTQYYVYFGGRCSATWCSASCLGISRPKRKPDNEGFHCIPGCGGAVRKFPHFPVIKTLERISPLPSASSLFITRSYAATAGRCVPQQELTSRAIRRSFSCIFRSVRLEPLFADGDSAGKLARKARETRPSRAFVVLGAEKFVIHRPTSRLLRGGIELAGRRPR
jgi:hypothetical protein